MATRISGGKALNMYAERIPWMLGGSADLAPSTKTLLTFDGAGTFTADTYAGRNFHFGIREHGMAAAVNGMTLSGLRAYGATFFVFSDYLRPSMRLSAIMGIPSIEVFTHDSIGVGEDGPTHQPVEQIPTLRMIPMSLILSKMETYVMMPIMIAETTSETDEKMIKTVLNTRTRFANSVVTVFM